VKSETRMLLADLKAAAQIGLPQSLDLAVDRLRGFPQVASNHPLSEAFFDQVILPAGAILSSPRLPLAWLRSLLEDPLAGVRAAAAAAVGVRCFEGKDISSQDLLRAGRDPRPEVRRALAESLGQAGKTGLPRLLDFITPWLEDPSVRLRQAALFSLAAAVRRSPAFALDHEGAILGLLDALHNDPDPDVRSALVAALVASAQAGLSRQLLSRMSRWADEADPAYWVISRSLSASWAAAYAQEALAILQNLEERAGQNSAISSARRALQRHQK
jgi:hypothetical protein